MYKLGMILVVIGSIGIVSALTLIVADKNKQSKPKNIQLQNSINKQTNSDSYQDNNMVENLLNSNPETENIVYIDDEDDYIDNICPNCKMTLNPDVKFCSNCGQKLV